MEETDTMLVIEEESLTATSNQATLKSSLKRRISPTRSVPKETKITGNFIKIIKLAFFKNSFKFEKLKMD